MPVQVTGEVCRSVKVGAYHGDDGHRARHPRADPAGPLRRPCRSAGRSPACCCAGRSPSTTCRRAASTAARCEFVFAVHGKGTAWLAERRPQDRLDVVGPLGKPFRLPAHPVNATLVGGGYGSAPLLPLAAGAARARLQVSLRARRRQRRPAVRPPRRQAHRRHHRRHHRRRLARRRRAGSPTCCRAVLGPHRLRRRLRLRADGDAARGRRPGRRAGHRLAGRGRGVDGLRHRGLHDLRAAGRRRRRPDPHGALLRRGAGVPRRPRALGRRRHACRPTPSAPSPLREAHR